MPVKRTRPPRTRLARLALRVGLATLLVVAGSARAQDLLALYEAARAYDATYLSARAQAESAQYRLAQTEALLRPSAGLSGGASFARTRPPHVGERSSNTQQLAVSARQPLFNRPDAVTIEQAQHSFEIARFDLVTAEQDLIVRLSQAYFDVLAAEDTLETIRTSKTAIEEQLASARRNFEVGTATITDTREAQARHDLVVAQELAAENDLRNKHTVLDQLVGRTGVQPQRLATPLVLPPLQPSTPDAWVSEAEAVHPAVRRARLALDIAELETDKARAAHLPTIDLVGSVSTTHATGSALAAQGTREGTSTGASIGVQLAMPLFAGYAIQNRVKETLTLEDKARNDLEATRRLVAQGTRQAFANLQSSQAQVAALEAAEASSQLALEATQLGYKVGVRVNVDVLNAQTQLFTTRRDLARARYDVALGLLRLRQAAGELTVEDVARVNGLLAP